MKNRVLNFILLMTIFILFFPLSIPISMYIVYVYFSNYARVREEDYCICREYKE